ncbi:YL8J protein, partial [Spelaeornis formosus]|nr:YL8J protein [Elachura formosa]
GAGPKYACAFCAKTFSRPSSLRIHTYSHTGERPFVCKEPSCRRRFSVQSNLKRHAKVHQLGAQNGGPPLHQPGPSHPIN